MRFKLQIIVWRLRKQLLKKNEQITTNNHTEEMNLSTDCHLVEIMPCFSATEAVTPSESRPMQSSSDESYKTVNGDKVIIYRIHDIYVYE